MLLLMKNVPRYGREKKALGKDHLNSNQKKKKEGYITNHRTHPKHEQKRAKQKKEN